MGLAIKHSNFYLGKGSPEMWKTTIFVVVVVGSAGQKTTVF